jgi:hypothetical protein
MMVGTRLGVHELSERPGCQRQDRDGRPDRDDDQPEQVGGQPVGALLLPLGEK